MAKNIEVKCNFTTVFAKYDTIEDLKTIANSICGQVKEAYDARLAEIKSGNTGVIVEVVDTAAATPQSKKKESKVTAAKEAAAKMKKQEAASSKAKTADTTTESTVLSPLFCKCLYLKTLLMYFFLTLFGLPHD